jgi:acetylornithine/succinyldiaminopimelate/putrescine aminotransferase
MPGFSYVPFNDYEALKAAVDENTCAIMLEPIQGEGGVRMVSGDYFKQVRDLCTRLGIVLILDEIQTGMGRTGTLFAYEQYGIEPDIVTLAKGLGGGVPIGATLARQEVAKAFTPGTHGSTFGGNPLACAAALATLETLLEDGIMLSECRRMGEYFMASLEKLQKHFPKIIVELRGKGLLIGMELTRDCAMVVQACFERGILINCTAGNTLRFTPPLIVVEEDIDRLISVLKEVMERLS